jgi:hypothetical protein
MNTILPMKVPLFCLAFFITITTQAQKYNYYYGNLHSHTGFSDGNKDGATTGVKTPAKSFAFAKESENFNFLGISEHNHRGAKMKLLNYAKGLQETQAANKDGKFVCLYGMEFGIISSGGHVLIYGVDQLIGWEKDNFDLECSEGHYNDLWDIIDSDFPDAFVTLAHPKPTDFNKLLTNPYNQTADNVICGVAIASGPAFAENTVYKGKFKPKHYEYFKTLLAAGYHVGPTIDHDNHNLTFGRMASSRTVVLSKELSQDSIVAAYKDMRFFASSDFNTKVEFTINGFPMGKRINTKKTASITVNVFDPDASDTVKEIRILFGKPKSKVLGTKLTSVSNSNTLSFSHDGNKEEEFYYYAEIIQKDGDKMYTSPIWVRRL